MKKSQKLLSGVVITSMLSASAFGIFTGNLQIPSTLSYNLQAEAADLEAAENHAYYNSFTGTVTHISPVLDTNGNPIDGRQKILAENKDGMLANFYVNEDTYWFHAQTVEVGDIVTGFYEADKPMIMIYPPQYETKILAVNVKDQQLKADIFDENLLSADKELKLNISNETQILDQAGKDYKGKIASNKLLVVYNITTMSLPAQTAPEKIIVLNDTSKETETNISLMDIVVNNKVITAPAAFTTKDNTVMVPIRAISEALGYKVFWNNASKTVTLNNSISLTVGKDYYTFAKMAPFTLGTAPVSIKGKVYVPLKFYQELVRVNTAAVEDGQIIIYNK